MTATRKRAATLGRFAAISSLARGDISDAAVVALIGDARAATHAEVGRLLGVAANTIKQSWVPQGMPGRRGSYSLATVVAWRLRYLAEIENRKLNIASLSGGELDRKHAEEELRKIRLQNDKLEREESLASGESVKRDDVATPMKAAAAVLVERLMKLPAKWEPSLPQDIAAAVIETAAKDIRRELVGFSESLARDILKEGRER